MVDRERVRGQVGQPGVFGVADVSFGAAAAAVERFEVGDVGVGAVGDEHLEAVTVDIGEGELRAGVGFFAAGDHPASRAASREHGDEVGDLGDLGVLAPVGAVGADRRLPRRFGQIDQDLGDVDGELMADHEPHVAVPAGVDEAVRPAGRVGPGDHLDARSGRPGAGRVRRRAR